MTHTIKTIFLHVTRACNLRCRYCYFSAAKADPGELTRSEYHRIWPELVAVAPAKVVFTGGEPLLRDDLLDLVSDLAEADNSHTMKRCLNTNGIDISNALVRRMVGLVDEVRVSLDGLRGVHDRHRGRGSFDHAIAALDLLRAEGFEPKVLVTITSDSIDELPAFLEWLAQQGLTRVRLNPVRLSGRAAASPNLAVSVDDVVQAVSLARRALGGHSPAKNSPTTLPKSCGAGHFVNVMPDGDVFPCHVLTDPAFRVGNLRSQRLSDLVGSKSLLQRLRSLDLQRLAQRSPDAAQALQQQLCLGGVKDNPELTRVLRFVGH